jgi:hypothetical protein
MHACVTLEPARAIEGNMQAAPLTPIIAEPTAIAALREHHT